MIKKIAILLMALAMIFSLCACGAHDAQSDKISGTGTEEDPWLCGATENDDVRVFAVDNCLYINGDGAMADFENPADRPWDGIIGDICNISIFDELKYVGKNAFKGAGANLNDEYVDLFLSGGIGAIGDSAFEGAVFRFVSGDSSMGAIITIPESVQSIGVRAFADSGVNEIYFDGVPEIADDAFAGNTCTAYVRNDADFERLPYGGEVTYKTLYAFNYVDEYGTDDMTGEGTMYIPEGEVCCYNAQDYVADENYAFVRYELLDGDLEIEDPENPELNISLTGDVSVKIVFAKVETCE